MKILTLSLLLTIFSATAWAHSGGQSLVCQSARNSGSSQKVTFTVNRANSIGLIEAAYTFTLNGKKYEFVAPDVSSNLGKTFHNSPLGVITITATTEDYENLPLGSTFNVVAIPKTVKAYSADGKLRKWNFAEEKDDCNDANGKATFRGIFRGFLNDGPKFIDVDTQVLDCVLEYTSGMAC